MYGLETAALTQRQAAELETAELKMLRFSLGVTRKDRIRNEHIRGTAGVKRLGEKLREARLRWYEHVCRRDAGYVGKRVLAMDIPGRRRRGRPKKKVRGCGQGGHGGDGAWEEDVEDRATWCKLTCCGDP